MTNKNNRVWILLILSLAAVVAFGVDNIGWAQWPIGRSRENRSGEKRVRLNLHPKAGPWLVMCASFDGADGKQQAVRLANELRTEHGLKSYVYREDFDLAQEIQGHGFQKPVDSGSENLQRRKMRLAKDNNKTEFAVLVGDFESVDSDKAQRILAQVKQLRPESMQLHSTDIQDSARAGDKIRAASEAMFGSEGGQVAQFSNLAVNSQYPLRTALLVYNPTLPTGQQQQVDRYILQLNQYIKHTLLKNPGAYTLKIASFYGQTIVRPGAIRALQLDEEWQEKNRQGKNNKSLREAAKRAHILTEYLRKKGYEAYQFHDRHSSYVCVGSFDWVSQGEGDNVVANPAIEKLAKLFRAQPANDGRQLKTFQLPIRLVEAGVTCDATPLTVAVPSAKGLEAVSKASRQQIR